MEHIVFITTGTFEIFRHILPELLGHIGFIIIGTFEIFRHTLPELPGHIVFTTVDAIETYTRPVWVRGGIGLLSDEPRGETQCRRDSQEGT